MLNRTEQVERYVYIRPTPQEVHTTTSGVPINTSLSLLEQIGRQDSGNTGEEARDRPLTLAKQQEEHRDTIKDR
jgi:hypothetical protein